MQLFILIYCLERFMAGFLLDSPFHLVQQEGHRRKEVQKEEDESDYPTFQVPLVGTVRLPNFAVSLPPVR